MTRRAALVEMLTEGRALDSLEALRIMTRTMLARRPLERAAVTGLFCRCCGLECQTVTKTIVGVPELMTLSACCLTGTTTTPTEGPYR